MAGACRPVRRSLGEGGRNLSGHRHRYSYSSNSSPLSILSEPSAHLRFVPNSKFYFLFTVIPSLSRDPFPLFPVSTTNYYRLIYSPFTGHRHRDSFNPSSLLPAPAHACGGVNSTTYQLTTSFFLLLVSIYYFLNSIFQILNSSFQLLPPLLCLPFTVFSLLVKIHKSGVIFCIGY